MNKLELVSIHSEVAFSLEAVAEKLNIEIDYGTQNEIGEVLWPLTEWIGRFRNNIFITTGNVTDFFFDRNDFVERILTLFPILKICATYYYSVPDQVGFAYFENGKRIRTWYGIVEEDVYVDFGKKLELEKVEPTFDSKSELECQLIKMVTGIEFSELLEQKIEMLRFKRIQNDD